MNLVYEVRDLTKTYKQGQVRANDGLSFDIHQGEIFGLLGPNGAGKTTLVRQLVGLLNPTSGTIRLFGEDVTRSAGTIPHRVSYLAQRPGVLENVPAEVAVALTGHTRGLTRHESNQQARDLLERLGLGDVRRKPIRYLSGGQQRLVALADRLPVPLQLTGVLLPPTYAARAFRTTLGAGDPSSLPFDLAILTIWAAVSLYVAVSRVEWRQD